MQNLNLESKALILVFNLNCVCGYHTEQVTKNVHGLGSILQFLNAFVLILCGFIKYQGKFIQLKKFLVDQLS